MNSFHYFLIGIACIMLSGQSAASERQLFRDDTILNAVLSAPLSQVYAQKKKDARLYMPATLSFLNANGSKQKLDLTVKTRGVFRRVNCRLPPLLLNFKKKTVANSLFAKQNKLKLVSPCASSQDHQQQLVLEYLTYQAFELISDKSLKTRLVRMSYIDSDNKRKPWTHLTFVIEDEKELAQRHAISAIHLPKIQPDQLDPVQATLTELFQLMIGNTDFSMLRTPGEKACCHNMQMLGDKNSSSNYFPVPYDFDSSGLIDAKYAVPADTLPINDVKKRLYRGRCRNDDVLADAIDLYKQREADILSLFANSEQLNTRYRKKSVKYLNQFFNILKDPNRVDREIRKRCRSKR